MPAVRFAARRLAGRLQLGRWTPSRGSKGQRRLCSGEASSAHEQARPTFQQLRRHFFCCAVPMVGFGLMDNSILIHAGDNIERLFGAKYHLTGLEAAATGQVLSDCCGVLFGGVIESVSRRYVAVPGLTQSQFALRMTQCVGTAGAAIGVVCGCLLGMSNLLLIDRDEAERLKKLAEMDSICQAVMLSAVNVMCCPRGTLFLVDHEGGELFSRSAAGWKGLVRRPLDETSSIAGWCAVNRKPAHVIDVQKDPRFCADIDNLSNITTTEMLCYPVYAYHPPDENSQVSLQYTHQHEARVIAVIQFINKPGGFGEADHLVMKMLSQHAAIFMENCACSHEH